MNNATGWVNQAGRDISRVANDAVNGIAQAGQDVGNWAQQNIVDPVTGAYDTASQWVQDRANDVNDWWNGTDRIEDRIYENGDQEENITHTPGARERIEQAAANAADTARNFVTGIPTVAGEAATNIGNAARNFMTVTIPTAAGQARRAIVDAAGNFVSWADETAANNQVGWTNENVANARIDLGSAVNSGQDSFGEMTNSPAAQQARAAGLSGSRLAALADVFGVNSPNRSSTNSNRDLFNYILYQYATGQTSDAGIDALLNQYGK